MANGVGVGIALLAGWTVRTQAAELTRNKSDGKSREPNRFICIAAPYPSLRGGPIPPACTSRPLGNLCVVVRTIGCRIISGALALVALERAADDVVEGAMIELIQEMDIGPARCFAVSRFLLDEVATGRRRPTLYLYSLADDHVSIGRFRFAPPDVPTHRRVVGGSVLPMGPGFLSAALILPVRDALTDTENGTLNPAQVMNRHVRVFMHACRAAGVDPIYPGRDVVTIGGKTVAALSLSQESSGAAVFEIVIALERGFDTLPHVLDRVDPGGDLVAPMLGADSQTSLADVLAQPLDREQMTRLYSRALVEHTGDQVRIVNPPSETEICGDSEGYSQWLRERTAEGMDYCGSAWGQIGVVEVAFNTKGEELAEIRVGGDFIATPTAVDGLEHSLRGCVINGSQIERLVSIALRRREEFILGLGSAPVVSRAIAQACESGSQ